MIMEKNKIYTLAIILLLVLMLYFGSLFLSADLQFITVVSGSMSPMIKAGDVILISKVKLEEIKEQDIITFRKGKTLITHRIIEIENNSFKTKGDANEDSDIELVKAGQVVGKVILIFPYLGYLGHFIRTLPGFLLFICIPGILIIYSEIRKIYNGKKAISKK